MHKYFIPYRGKKVASLDINGHNLVILSCDRDSLQNSMELIGADSVRTIKVNDSALAEQKILGKLAQQVKGGVVIAPTDIELSEVIKNLEYELPWFH